MVPRTSGKQNAFWLEYADRHYWDARTSRWAGMPRLVNFYLDLLENDIRSFLSKQHGKILDIGCGDGRFLAYADVGVDFSQGMLKRAKQKNPSKSLVLASATHLPFRDGVFDLSFMVTVLLHIHPNKRNATRLEAFRAAKKFYNFDSIKGKIRISWFTKIFLKLNKQGLGPTPLAALVSLFISFPIERIHSTWRSLKYGTTYILEEE